MPKVDMIENADIARIPQDGGDSMPNTNNRKDNCSCQHPEPTFPQGYWIPGCPPPPPGCVPPPPPYPPYPYECPTGSGVGSIEAQIAKLSKKAATIRKMIDNLVNKNKPIIISIGCGVSYNFGTMLDKEGNETAYGTSVLEILEAELEAIKAKIVELTAELEVADEATGKIESTVTKL